MGFFLLEGCLRHSLWHLPLRRDECSRVASWRKYHHRSAELRPSFAVVNEKTLSRPQRAMEAAQKNTSKTAGGFSLKGESCLIIRSKVRGVGIPCVSGMVALREEK